MKVNIEKLVENEIAKRDLEVSRLYEGKITFTEYTYLKQKRFTEIALLRELEYIYGE